MSNSTAADSDAHEPVGASDEEPTVQAAGGVVVDLSRGKPRYLLIHRPAYDDWSLPKGKLLAGERHRDAALREVAEETGYTCELRDKLSPVTYRRPTEGLKRVKYWLMEPMKGEFAPNDEVDAITWLKRSSALSLMSYVHDQAVLVEAHLAAKEIQKARKRAAAEAIGHTSDHAPNGTD